jgi:hypothetical protein
MAFSMGKRELTLVGLGFGRIVVPHIQLPNDTSASLRF